MTEIVIRALPGVLVALAIVCAVAALSPPAPRPARSRPNPGELWRGCGSEPS